MSLCDGGKGVFSHDVFIKNKISNTQQRRQKMRID